MAKLEHDKGGTRGQPPPCSRRERTCRTHYHMLSSVIGWGAGSPCLALLTCTWFCCSQIRGQERVLQGLVGATESSSSSGSSKNATGSSPSGTVPPGISIGDCVVRGPAWNWGDQDGGPGGRGTVIDVGCTAFAVLLEKRSFVKHPSNVFCLSWQTYHRRTLSMRTYRCNLMRLERRL